VLEQHHKRLAAGAIPPQQRASSSLFLDATLEVLRRLKGMFND